MKCEGCLRPVTDWEKLKCYLCSNAYHHQCVNMTSAKFRELDKCKWQCPGCDNVTRRRSSATRQAARDETPTRKQFDARPPSPPVLVTASAQVAVDVCEVQPAIHRAPASPPDPFVTPSILSSSADTQINSPGPSGTSGTITYDQFALLLDTRLVKYREAVTAEFTVILTELRASFQEEVASLRAENVKLKDELVALGQKLCSSDVTQLKDSINVLQCQLNDRDQDLLLNDVEITCIPECEGESVGHLVLAVAAKLGMELEERDIVSAARVGPRYSQSEGAPAPRPRPIVVRLARRLLRDQLLKSARVRRGATTAELGLPPHETRRFYVNERLTKTNRAIFARARDACREARWRFVWSKDGRIYARKDQTSQRMPIRKEEDVTTFIKH